MNLVFDRAWQHALELHRHDRYGLHEYRFHLSNVVAELDAIRANLPTRIAAVFHDAIEGGHITRDELARQYGDEVAGIVWSVSHEGGNRREQARCIVAKLELMPTAIDVKLSDRKSNMQTSLKEGNARLFSMYLKEVDVYESVFSQGHPVLYAGYRALCERPLPRPAV
ncbi:HD domain-containing protein [Burkholderia cenocepacia]|uniref:HD domain-containing protein n=1 Tax=Burkholderia cenocepacia TaxID=95486 RepID=UPI000761A922|nr:HD domain-containing protein [Burkholderia cenocepacia]KWU19137.1 hypothetical protein AS149_12885 [Burkholderia cenocepacia]